MNTWTQKRIKATKDVWRRVGSITKRLPAGGGDGLFRLPSFAPHTPRKDVTAAAYWEPKRLPPALREDVVDFFRPSKFLIHEAASPDANDRIPIPQVGRRSPRLAQATAADDRAAFLRKKNLDSPAAGHDGSIAMEARPFPLRSEELPPPVATFDPEPHPQRTEVPLTQPVEAAEDATSKAAHRVGERDKFPAAADPKAKPSNAGIIGIGREGARAVFKPRHSNKPLTQQAPFRPSIDARATKRVPSSNRRDEDDIYKPFRARPMPSSTKQSIGVGKGHKSVSLMEARPFPLMSEERGRDKQALPAQRLLAQQKQDEAATSFRARPLPAPSKGFAPRRSERPPTEVREFRLSSRAHNKRAEVHALPPPVATIDPEPHPQRRKVPLTQPVEMTLRSSAARAGERRRWDMKNRARLDAAERRRLEEKEAVAELRRRPIEEGGMAFKAKPITRSSAPATGSPRPHGSTAPSTTPTTRNLRTTRRALNAAPR